MAPTWREERPEAITAASHKAVRPSRSIVTIFSALSSSSDARMRFNRSLCGFLAADATGCLAVFLAAAFCAVFFWTGADFLTVFADFLAGTFFAAFGARVAAFLPAGFLVRVRAQVPLVSGDKV